jgi:hypothetical protein
MVIPKEQFVELIAKNVDPVESLSSANSSRTNSVAAAGASSGGNGGGGGGGGFIDADISTGTTGAGRELVAWQPDADVGADHHKLSLDAPDDGEWDQFAVNEMKFGVTSTWSEEHYTTSIDKSHADYRRKEREAQRVAAQIEREARTAATTNVHLLEERGEDVSHIDEEARYGAVVRDAEELPTTPAAAANHAAPADSSASGATTTTTAAGNKDQSGGGSKRTTTSSSSSKDGKDRPQKESSKGDKKRTPLTNEVRDYNAINALNLEPSSKAFERARLARLQQIQQQTTPLVLPIAASPPPLVSSFSNSFLDDVDEHEQQTFVRGVGLVVDDNRCCAVGHRDDNDDSRRRCRDNRYYFYCRIDVERFDDAIGGGRQADVAQLERRQWLESR